MNHTLTIKKLQVHLNRQKLPTQIYAVFNDGWRLIIYFQKRWHLTSAYLEIPSESRRLHLDASPFRHHVPDEIQTADMTRKDWADVCFRYRMEMMT
jgi:hypothetical protein